MFIYIYVFIYTYTYIFKERERKSDRDGDTKRKRETERASRPQSRTSDASDSQACRVRTCPHDLTSALTVGSNRLVRSLFCTGARRNPMTCGTNQSY